MGAHHKRVDTGRGKVLDAVVQPILSTTAGYARAADERQIRHAMGCSSHEFERSAGTHYFLINRASTR